MLAVGCGGRSARQRELSTDKIAQPVAVTTEPAAISQPTTRTLDPLSQEIVSYPALHRAAAIGDVVAVRALLDDHADVNERAGESGATPLHLAMMGAWNDMLRRGVPPKGTTEQWSVAKARQRERETRGQVDPEHGPMQFLELTKVLLAAGADPNVRLTRPRRGRNPYGVRPIETAIHVGNAEIVRLLLAAAEVDLNEPVQGPNRETTALLALAAQRGDIETVQLLLDAGADVARVPEFGQATMRRAAFADVALLRLLLDHGLAIPKDAAKSAGRIGNREVLEELERRGTAIDRDAALLSAIAGVDRDGISPEAEEALLQKVRQLLDSGASPSAPAETGEAILEALVRGQTRVVALLRERGGKVDWTRQTKSEFRPGFIAYSAAFVGKPEQLKAFEDLGMPLDILGAAILGRDQRLKQLIAADDTQVVGEAGATALVFSARYGHLSSVQILLDAKADPNAKMPSWDTPDIGPRPLELAIERGHEDIAMLLLDRGADPKLLDPQSLKDAKISEALRTRLTMPR